MEQIKYILYSVLILAGTALTYAVMKPVFQSEWVAAPATVVDGDTAPAKAATVKNTAGKNLFSANCQTCHAIAKDLTGPALANVESKGPWTNRENLVKWVKNPAAFIPTTPYTTALAAQYNGQVMPSFPQLSNQEINQIFDYISEASAAVK
jgi:mono/diheme cytochrome c family protein